MGATSPEMTAGMFIERFNAGDAGGMVKLYEDDAVFTYDGEEKAIGRGQIETEEMARIIESRDRRRAGQTAPAQGLMLWKVQY